jgi:hypothetical protein
MHSVDGSVVFFDGSVIWSDYQVLLIKHSRMLAVWGI